MIRHHSKSSRRAIKGFKLETALKTVQAMRKSLIEASTQALLTADELEDAAFMGVEDDDAMRMGAEPDYEVAMQACKQVEEHIRAAIGATEEAKIALRSGMTAEEVSVDDSIVTDAPIMSASTRRVLKRRRQKARLRKS